MKTNLWVKQADSTGREKITTVPSNYYDINSHTQFDIFMKI